jgi:hypothetical protein
MMKELAKLSAEDAELMLKSPLLVWILIAGADGHIDRKEIKGAVKLMQANVQRKKSSLNQFYQVAVEDFEDKLKILIQTFPSDTDERNPVLIDELRKLNDVLSKVNRLLAIEFCDSLRELAKRTAQSSGGLLGINSVTQAEAEFIELPMIVELS